MTGYKALPIVLQFSSRIHLLMLWLSSMAIVFIPIVAYTQTPTLNDKEIKLNLIEQLSDNEAVDSNWIDIQVDDGVVELSGHVNHILEKERAEELAEITKGVVAVVNRIDVKPTEVSDQKIRKNVKNELLYNPVTEQYPLRVQVNDGHVTLEGTVDSWVEKNLAKDVAQQVLGIKSVDNQIDVQYKTKRSDFEIKQDIQARLQEDKVVRAGMMDVMVEEGKVTLTGTTGSLAEKKRAKEIAWVMGVKEVNNKLKVDWAHFHSQKDKWLSHYLQHTDKDLKKAVRKAIEEDPRVSAKNVNINVYEGTVTLSGTVTNLSAKNAAKEDANNTAGVLRVKNFLNVRFEQKFTEQQIMQDLRDRIEYNPYLYKKDVHVTANNGTVYITGNVDTAFEKNYAEEVISRNPGVTKIINRLTVGSEWIGEWGRALKEDIRDEMWWSPFLDATNVDIAVEDGVATLTGKVDTWNERWKAEENAYEGGAKKVVNLIEVKETIQQTEDTSDTS